MRRLTAFVTIAVLVVGLSACSKHGAKNVYSCPDKGDGVGVTTVKKGKLTVQTALPAPQWWQGATVDKLTGGYEFELAKELCAQLGIGRVRIVDVDRDHLVAGTTDSFDVGIAQIVPVPDAAKVDYSASYYTTPGGESYSVLLSKGSSNTKLVSAAIERLKSSGALDALAKKWLTSP